MVGCAGARGHLWAPEDGVWGPEEERPCAAGARGAHRPRLMSPEAPPRARGHVQVAGDLAERSLVAMAAQRLVERVNEFS